MILLVVSYCIRVEMEVLAVYELQPKVPSFSDESGQICHINIFHQFQYQVVFLPALNFVFGHFLVGNPVVTQQDCVQNHHVIRHPCFLQRPFDRLQLLNELVLVLIIHFQIIRVLLGFQTRHINFPIVLDVNHDLVSVHELLLTQVDYRALAVHHRVDYDVLNIMSLDFADVTHCVFFHSAFGGAGCYQKYR